MQGRRVVEEEMKQHGLEMIKCFAPHILYAYHQAAFIHFSFSTLSSLLSLPHLFPVSSSSLLLSSLVSCSLFELVSTHTRGSPLHQII